MAQPIRLFIYQAKTEPVFVPSAAETITLDKWFCRSPYFIRIKPNRIRFFPASNLPYLRAVIPALFVAQTDVDVYYVEATETGSLSAVFSEDFYSVVVTEI